MGRLYKLHTRLKRYIAIAVAHILPDVISATQLAREHGLRKCVLTLIVDACWRGQAGCLQTAGAMVETGVDKAIRCMNQKAAYWPRKAGLGRGVELEELRVLLPE